MKIALAGARFRNRDVDFNLRQIRCFMKEAKESGAQLVCFGEAFLQGFDAFSWRYENDRETAISVQDEMFQQIEKLTLEYGIDLLFGFLEREEDKLYSSCALIAEGKCRQCYRRVSIGWKEYSITDEHYCEGEYVQTFDYHGFKCAIALCGDLWDVTAPRFSMGQDVLFWPLYVNFSREEWENAEKQAYAEQAAAFGGDVLMINSVDDDDQMESPALGGCCHFKNGKTQAEWPMGSEGMLLVELSK